MNPAWITGAAALRERLLSPAQAAPQAAASALPAYLESFLAHLRLLIGLPFEYLVPDSRLLPEESIRFFYVDRSFTDRLVDGALAVGKVGTREQAHHQAQEPSLRATLDRTERVVRILQRGAAPFAQARQQAAGDAAPAQVTTGFLLRSAAVANWPDMEVRAFVMAGAGTAPQPLTTLRLERLQTSMLLALFEGVPDRVTCEEPHHGVMFGVDRSGENAFRLALRGPDGSPVAGSSPVAVPFRTGGRGVVAIAELRRRLHAGHVADPTHVIAQTGAGSFAVSVLDPPWRQRFEGRGGAGHPVTPAGGLSHPLTVAARAADAGVRSAVEEVVG